MNLRTLFRTTLAMAFLLLMIAAGSPAAGQSGAAPLNAVLVSSLPDTPEQQEKYFKSLRQGGADTVIYAPDDRFTLPDRESLPKLVFAVHQARLKLFLVLPIRTVPAVLAAHPDWEDLRYDLGSGTIQPTGRIDLFNPAAVVYLASLYGEIASYSVDGILFGADFYYGDAEGMSPLALEEYERRNGKALIISRAITKTAPVEGGRIAVAYGEGYEEWETLKKERLVETLRAVMTAARTANKSVAVGIPLHALGLTEPQDAFRKFGYDMMEFEKIPVDYYWIAILHRNIRTQQGIRSYRKSLEELGRIALGANTAVKDPSRLIIVLQTSERGRVLPLSEIEEARAVAKKAGEANIGFTAGPGVTLPASFTQKLFRR